MVSITPDAQSPAADTDRPRYHLGRLGAHEELQIPATWPGLKGLAGLLVTLPIWILAASFKFGAKTLYAGWTGPLVVLAIATCVFLAYAVLLVVWWVGGSERLAVIGGDLLICHALLGLAVSTRSYRGRDIRFLDVVDMPRGGWLDEPLLPFATSGRCGRLKFYYQEATVYLGHDLGAADARRATAWLAQRLPATATR